MNEVVLKSFPIEMLRLTSESLEAGDRVVLIVDGSDIKIYVNNELTVHGQGEIPDFLEDVKDEFGGGFLADGTVGEGNFTFYPRYLNFSAPDLVKELEGDTCQKL